ncbi:MAG: hypothetical protein QXH03_02880 [Candidatus Bathyarchaeia archaeon]
MASKTWHLIIHTIPPERREALIQYCQLTSKVDETFKIKQIDKHIIIELPTKDRCHKVGMLLHHRFNIYYEVERS